MLKSQRGFTLIELMVAITIMAVLTGIGAVIYAQSQSVARDDRRKQDIKTYRTAFELFYQRHGYYPSYESNIQGDSTSTNWPNLFYYVYNAGTPIVDSSEKITDYISIILKDPINSSHYHYNYHVQSSGKGYLFCISFENTNNPSYHPEIWGPGQDYCEKNP